jgi:hypothetical protein
MEVMVADVISSLGRLRSNLVRLLMRDGSVYIQGIGVVLQVSRENANLTRKGLISWVYHIVLSYDIIILLQCILYIYFIHNDIFK